MIQWKVKRVERDGKETTTLVFDEEIRARELYKNWCDNRGLYKDRSITLIKLVTTEQVESHFDGLP